jgi:hypothetical protein
LAFASSLALHHLDPGPERDSPSAILLRESYRTGGKVKTRSREELLAATEKNLAAITAAMTRSLRPLRGKDHVALRAGAVLGRRKVASTSH